MLSDAVTVAASGGEHQSRLGALTPDLPPLLLYE
eukprot:CAMPEP_0171110854 /NCGR_PEP_ID=MMETSP0766_2-20121228/72819_1 /TAXON_ID=439317 /ORGANISM="Gambierdiscus australes, Strain CAWD 149" /LENGTH=33 /DNA_ID= /DNA_START= /DNA_END= /DNA_ORIENTATION=